MKTQNRLSSAGWLTLTVLIGFLVIAGGYSVKVWVSISDTHMTGFGWFCLTMGVVVSVGLGGGLMGLVFYSSRHDLDR